jgi:SAM-dependent methyltransferase
MTTSRLASIYADFLLPYVSKNTHLIDVGCGSGELSIDLAASVRWLTGVDCDEAEVQAAQRAADASGTLNVDFVLGDAYGLAARDSQADAVFAHSLLEALDRPGAALQEMQRVLRPGGLVAVASVEYAGLILAGPHEALVRRFYDIRQRLWQLNGADPFRGRDLRGLLLSSGYVRVEATTKAISYGTSEAVSEFGSGRAAECAGDWYSCSALEHGLATPKDLTEMRSAWLEWAESPSSYAAFTWCRALGWKP